jgi:hypothetical protein
MQKKEAVSPTRAAPTTQKGLRMPVPKKSIPDSRTGPLADFRMLLSIRPDALYLEARELARLLGCSKFAAEHARFLVIEDGLEVVV